MKVDMISVGPNPFPCHNGEALAWDPGPYMTWNEAGQGYPKAMTVLRALRDYCPNRFDLMHIAKDHDILLDLMVNHLSAQSIYFKDFLEKGNQSEYADLFIPLEKYWENGIAPQEDIDKMFLRRI